MFDFFVKNSEIRTFFKNFPSTDWPKLTELLLTYSIRKILSKTQDLSMKSISYLVSITPSSSTITKALSSMKQEIKDLTSAIKRIESGQTERSNSFKHLKNHSNLISDRNLTPACTPVKELKEPRVCSLKAAERLKRCKNLIEVDFSVLPEHLIKVAHTTKHSPLHRSRHHHPSTPRLQTKHETPTSSQETSSNTCNSPALFVKRN